MTPERWGEVERLYHAALERTVDERASFLTDACRGDETLRDEVESLLAYQSRARDFIETPAASLHASLMPVANAVRRLHESSVPGRFAGRVFGSYELKELIAAGGMGEVYRARDARLDRAVAIKVLPPSVAGDADRLRRLQQEARAAAALNHPNIVAVHDVGEHDGSPYIVEELIEGPTLRELLKSGGMPTRRAVDYAIQIASGLGAAHRTGLVHRDLKPDNIIVGVDGRVRVLDFGLAKVTSAVVADRSVPPHVTEPGVVFGTAAYMAPEQVRGEGVDHRADIFAFGAILYEMVTGRRAFDRPTAAETMAAVLKEDPTETTAGGIPPGLERIVRRCLEKDPANRFDSARDVAFALETITGSGAIVAPSPSVRRIRPAASWPWGIVAGAVLIAAVATLRPLMMSEDVTTMRFSAVTNFAGLEAQPSLSPDGSSAAFVSNRDGQHDIWVGLVSGGNLIRITNDPNIESQPRWSPDGTRIAFSRLAPSGLADIWIVPALGGPSRRLIENASGPAWSWDGNRLAYSRAGQIWAADANGGNQTQITTPAPNTIHSRPSFSRDGTRIAFINRYAGPYSELSLVDLRTSQFRDLTQDDRAALSPVWAPRDDFIYFTSSRGGSMNVWKMPTGGGEPTPVTLGPGDDAEIDLSADGARMLLATYRSNLNVAEIELVSDKEGRVRWLTQDSARSELAPAYSKDGLRIAYFSNRQGGEVESLWVMNATGGSDATSFTDEGRISVFPRWSADGSLFYVSRPRHGAHELRRRSTEGGTSEHVSKVFVRGRWGDVAQDGRIIIAAAGGKAEVYDPRTTQTRTIQGVGSAPVWSRDGRLIASLTPSRSHDDPNAGIWVTDGITPARQVFKGWVLSCAWASGALYAIRGSADGMGSLWKVPLSNDAPTRIDVTIPLLLGITSPYWYEVASAHIDVHPSDRRIALQAYEFNESDIVLVENVR